MKVLVVGHPAVTSDAEGAFVVDSVEVPYALAHVSPSGGIDVYLGVTRLDPTLRGMSRDFRSTVTATLTGTVADPNAPQMKTWLAFSSATPTGEFTNSTSQDPTEPGATVYWEGTDDSVVGSLYALSWVPNGAEGVDRYVGFGRTDGVRLTQGESSHWTVELRSVKTHQPSVQVTPPPCDPSDVWRRCYLTLARSGSALVDEANWQGPPPDWRLACAAPDAPEAKMSVGVDVRCADGSSLHAGMEATSEARELQFVPAPMLLEPRDGMRMSTGSEFRWSPTTTISEVDVRWDSGSFLRLFTSNDSAVLPDLSELAGTPNENASGWFAVTAWDFAVYDITTVDQMLSEVLKKYPRYSRSASREVSFQR